MNFNSFGRTARNHGRRGGGRGGRGGGRHGGRGGGRNNNNNKNSVHPSVLNKSFNHAHYIESSGTMTSTSFNVAVQGCSHGELDSIYSALEAYCDQPSKNRGWLPTPADTTDPINPMNIDVLLCCGDVQTLRNTDDYHALAVPQKYKAMGDFHQYYSGAKVAPILTIMIGGNHESSNYLQELYYGGWVAPNIYYLGAAGVVNLCKFSPDKTSVSTLRIAGLSGIYKSHDYTLGRFETPPYSNSELRSVYHTRHSEVERLRAIASSGPETSIDIMISHDWPRGIEQHGNVNSLIQQKPFFKQEIQSNTLGSPANEVLLHALRPKFWFAAHLHVKFEAIVNHGANPADYSDDCNRDTKFNTTQPSDGSTNFIGMESNEGICPDRNETNMESLTDQMTKFLSLDKCLPKRRHLQVLHVEPSSTRNAIHTDAISIGDQRHPWLEYDPTWLSIHRRTENWSQKTQNRLRIPDDEFEKRPITSDELKDLEERLKLSDANRNNKDRNNHLAIPLNFVQTVRPHDPQSRQKYGPPQEMIGNPQTDAFLKMMGMEHNITIPFQEKRQPQRNVTFFSRSPLAMPVPKQVNDVVDDNEIELDDNSDDVNNNQNTLSAYSIPISQHTIDDDNEIDLDEDDTGNRNTKDSQTISMDPGEINLDDDNETNDSGSCTTESAVKRPRV